MIFRTAFLKVVTTISLFCFLSVTQTYAQNNEEAITSFFSTVRVNTNNSVSVTEDIVYTTGPQARHGIYRDIRPISSSGYYMKITNVVVTDVNNSQAPFVILDNNETIRIKIGDPNVTFSGSRLYHIQYTASYAVAQLQNKDEIYWNVTGNEWNIPIYKAGVKIILPENATSTEYACYYGGQGSTNRCLLSGSSLGLTGYVFDTPTPLPAREGLTVAVGFPKGIVTAYTQDELAQNARDVESYSIIGFNSNYISNNFIGWLVVAVAMFSIMFSYWYRNWRDPKGKSVIVVQYDVPDGLTPMEVIGIVKESVSNKSISAEIVYLATQGYIKIKQIQTKSFFGFVSTDYELIALKDFSDIPNTFDKDLLNALFEKDKSIIRLSSLANVFYVNTPKITNGVTQALLTKKYYKNLGRLDATGMKAFIFGVLVVGLYLFIDMPGIVLIIIIFGIFWYLSPVKTEHGVATKDYLLGLKKYLQVAEKDRIAFHNAPEKNPEIFEKLLPFAMVFGVDKAWAKEFEGIYMTPPSWYEGASGAHFSAITFGSSMTSFGSFVSSSVTGGSDGGGGSGGGGGGGGGGGW